MGNNERSFSKTKYIKNDFSERMVIKEIEIFNQNKIQEQPSRGVLRKRGSENMQQIYRRTFKSKCDLNNVAKQLYRNHNSAWEFSCKICCIISEHLFLRRPLDGSFWKLIMNSTNFSLKSGLRMHHQFQPFPKICCYF